VDGDGLTRDAEWYDVLVRAWLIAIVAAGGCHLADSPEPPTCQEGFHVENQRCVQTQVIGQLARIQSGCVLSPDPFVVQANKDFQFENDDADRHVVSGLGGALNEDLASGAHSRFVQITKPGSYPYDVSGCPKGGTIQVE
jgi:hypothetical protein